MKKYLILLVHLLFLMAQCHKTPTPEPNPTPDLPPATQEGKGTIGCYINGKPWVPKPYISIGGAKYLAVGLNTLDPIPRLFIQSINKESNNQSSISLVCTNPQKGDNVLEAIKPGFGWPIFESNSFKGNCGEFYLDTTKVHRLILNKFDNINSVASGTFEFTAYNDCRDTLRFTQGRFDAYF